MSKNEVKEFNVFGNVYGVSLWRSGMSVIFDMLDDQAGNKENSELHEYKQALNQEGEYSLKMIFIHHFGYGVEMALRRLDDDRTS